MITRRSFAAALSSSERQLLRSQYVRSGHCARCFHSSRRQQADEQRPEDGAPAIKDSAKRADNNGPQIQKKPTKRGRAELISNELSMLQKGPPPGDPTSGPGSATGTNQGDPAKPTTSAGFTETPTSMGGPEQRMGENVSAGREGVNAQGVGRLAGTDERVRNEHPRPQSTRKAGEVEDPAEGGTSVLEASTPGPASKAMEVASSSEAEADPASELDQRQEGQLRHKLTESRPQGLPVRPRKIQAKDLLLQGRGAGVPLAAHPTTTILDRYKLVTDPSHNTNEPAPRRQIIIGKQDRKRVAKALIAGQYDTAGALAGKQVYKQAILNEVAKKTLINGTYLESDGNRLIKRVQGLLPAAQPARGAAGGQKQKAAPVKAKAKA
ncbi:hypothetical protein Slin15195_G075420 [Septoria linicola]|uniref:Uncharacterized protein n=1 Tax=Septoria linicola TaxID=215465 RepID=A0A9Q9AY72_9PEZI|nr:hypothetical protein Slin14017_G036510 [Septoria linicola]USW54223.1 hypothetical protein Slin15195_G075420 [Septoria linicola]